MLYLHVPQLIRKKRGWIKSREFCKKPLFASLLYQTFYQKKSKNKKIVKLSVVGHSLRVINIHIWFLSSLKVHYKYFNSEENPELRHSTASNKM